MTLAGFDEETLNKTPQMYATECNLISEYELIVAYYELFGANKAKISRNNGREINSEMNIE